MFNKESLRKKFQDIGSDVEFIDNLNPALVTQADPNVLRSSVPVTVDVRKVKGNETFFIRYNPKADFDMDIVDVQKADKHLLLMIKDKVGQGRYDVSKLLCGHDERHFFSCGVPGNPKNVREAKENLLPPEFLNEQKMKAKKKNYLKRKNEAGRRQGEWVFIPVENLNPDPLLIKKNEPISRGARSKPHICEELYSLGGRTVYVHDKYAPNGVTKEQIPQIQKQIRQREGRQAAQKITFQTRTANAVVYARGAVRHSDHKTIILKKWHKVLMNTEAQAKSSIYSVFLD